MRLRLRAQGCRALTATLGIDGRRVPTSKRLRLCSANPVYLCSDKAGATPLGLDCFSVVTQGCRALTATLGIDGRRVPTSKRLRLFLPIDLIVTLSWRNPVGVGLFVRHYPGLPPKPGNPGLWGATALRLKNLLKLCQHFPR